MSETASRDFEDLFDICANQFKQGHDALSKVMTRRVACVRDNC